MNEFEKLHEAIDRLHDAMMGLPSQILAEQQRPAPTGTQAMDACFEVIKELELLIAEDQAASTMEVVYADEDDLVRAAKRRLTSLLGMRHNMAIVGDALGEWSRHTCAEERASKAVNAVAGIQGHGASIPSTQVATKKTIRGRLSSPGGGVGGGWQ